VLYKAEPHRVLETMRDQTRVHYAKICQRVIRGHSGRVKFLAIKVVYDAIRDAIASRNLETLDKAIALGNTTPFKLFILR